jgi:hypothetical protein
MTVREILRAFRPETGGRETDWDAFAARVWKEERAYVDKLKRHMARMGSWVAGPVVVNDGVVQDAHHRLSSPRFFLNRFF